MYIYEEFSRILTGMRLPQTQKKSLAARVWSGEGY